MLLALGTVIAPALAAVLGAAALSKARDPQAVDRSFADLDVPAERRVIREHAMRADHAVVTDVGAGHEKIVVRDTRDELILRRAAVDRAVLAKRVALADLEPSRLALVLQVLRRGADRCELKDMIIAPDRRGPLDHDMRTDAAARCDRHVRTDHRVGTDLDIAVDIRSAIDQGSGMDGHCYRE